MWTIHRALKSVERRRAFKAMLTSYRLPITHNNVCDVARIIYFLHRNDMKLNYDSNEQCLLSDVQAISEVKNNQK